MNSGRCAGTTSHKARRVAVFTAALLGAALLPAREPSRPSIRVSQGKESVIVSADNRQVLEYRRSPSPYKPYVSKLYSPSGVQILRDSPGDHKHHHALMFAVAAGGVNFWEETEGSGTQRSRSLKLTKGTTSSGMRRAGFTQTLDWVNPRDGRVLLEEQRTVEVLIAADLAATLLTWKSRLKPAAGDADIALSGAHYHGLGMRFLESMDRGGRLFNADGLDGQLVRGSERLTPTRWCAYTASAGPGPVTVAIFDHPANPRPALLFTMTTPFAYLAATLNLWKEPLTLGHGATVDLSYGVAVWDGIVEPAQIESLYRSWIK